MKTRAQEDLILAEKLVTQVLENGEISAEAKDTYRQICKSFPVMVRICGLCQAIAFSKAKVVADNKTQADAHGLILRDVGELLHRIDSSVNQSNPLEAIRKADATTYILYTRRVLSAWVYIQRFAESILKGIAPTGGSDHAE